MDHSTLRTTPLENFPPPERWDDWEELDAKSWPRRVKKQFSLVPTICFNCEAACGLVAYVDKARRPIRKVEGNPYHPGSRGRNCAKGPATHQPGPRPRPHPLPDEARGPARQRALRTRELGRGAHDARRPHPQGDRRRRARPR
jgi:hypothetical protein